MNKLMSRYKWDRKVNRECLAQRGMHCQPHSSVTPRCFPSIPLGIWSAQSSSSRVRCHLSVGRLLTPEHICDYQGSRPDPYPTGPLPDALHWTSAPSRALSRACPVAVCRPLPLPFPFYFSFSFVPRPSCPTCPSSSCRASDPLNPPFGVYTGAWSGWLSRSPLSFLGLIGAFSGGWVRKSSR